MNLPNKITIARIALIPFLFVFFFLGFLANNLWYVASAIIFALLCSTDFIDGYIARKTDTVTNFGKFLDPIADKVLVVAGMFLVTLLSKNNFTALSYGITFTLLVGRDFIISGFRLIAAQSKVVISADIWGKLKTIALDVALTVLLISVFNEIILYIGIAILYIATIISIFSGVNYILKNKAVLK